MRAKIAIILLMLGGCICSCKKDHSPEPSVDTKKLEEAFSSAKQIGNLKSLVVFHKNSIIKEVYYGTGGADLRHDVRSVTKSVTGILIGIAIDKGYLSSIDQTLGEVIDPQDYTITAEKSALNLINI